MGVKTSCLWRGSGPVTAFFASAKNKISNCKWVLPAFHSFLVETHASLCEAYSFRSFHLKEQLYPPGRLTLKIIVIPHFVAGRSNVFFKFYFTLATNLFLLYIIRHQNISPYKSQCLLQEMLSLFFNKNYHHYCMNSLLLFVMAFFPCEF